MSAVQQLQCAFCGNFATYLFKGGCCFECTESDGRIEIPPTPVDPRSAELRAFDLSVAMDRAGQRSVEIANEDMRRSQRGSGTSLQEYFRVGELLKGDGRAAADALGLVSLSIKS